MDEPAKDEELLDYKETLTRMGMGISMVYYLHDEFHAIDKNDEVVQIDFGPKNTVFEKVCYFDSPLRLVLIIFASLP